MSYVAERGRRLLIEFTCGRCGATECKPFEEKIATGFKTQLRAQNVPTGWREDTGDLPLLCPKCKAALNTFMNNQEVTK